MGFVFRKQWSAPLPAGAQVVESGGARVARWRERGGKARSAEVFVGSRGIEKIRGETRTYYLRYRDADGRMVEVATGCREEAAATAMLRRFELRVERVRAGILSHDEEAVVAHAAGPLESHLGPWIRHLELKQASPEWTRNAASRIRRVAADCGMRLLRDVVAEPIERWLAEAAARGLSPGTRNGYRTTLVAFLNWCVRSGRLPSNPLRHVAVANDRIDRRRERRALTEEELGRLLDAARRRPLADALTVRTGARRGQRAAKVADAVQARLERLGRERALLYKTLVLTGLRKSELASLTVGQAALDGPSPHLALRAKDEKSRRGAQLPLREDLASELREWLAERLGEAKAAAARAGVAEPSRLPASEGLFVVPRGLIRIFDRDLVFAGIARLETRGGRQVVVKADEYGRTIDVHALRHTFCSQLAKAGVPLRTAQAAMRHSDPSLTANVYTDPRMLDVAGALGALPALPLDKR